MCVCVCVCVCVCIGRGNNVTNMGGMMCVCVYGGEKGVYCIDYTHTGSGRKVMGEKNIDLIRYHFKGDYFSRYSPKRPY